MNQLSPSEQSELQRLESIIEKGLADFVNVGCALSEIREAELYRPYSTFDEYCRSRWAIGKSQAHRLRQAAEVVANLEHDLTSPMGEVPLPASERQARPLAQLPKTEQPAAWREAVQTAPGGKVTAAHVEQVTQSRAERLGIKPAVPFKVADETDETDEPAEQEPKPSKAKPKTVCPACGHKW